MSTTTKTTTKTADAARAAQMIVGLGKHFPNVGSLTIEGAARTLAQIEASLQALVDLRKAVNDARAAAKAKLAAETAQAPALRTFMDAVATVVKGSFGNSPDVLADFGLAPKKVRTPLTVEQKAAAAAKRTATRAARHTMGSKQRKDVKGAVTGVTITPVTAPHPVATAPATNAPPTGATAAAPAPHVP